MVEKGLDKDIVIDCSLDKRSPTVPVRIIDVAHRAGASSSTVSRVLANKPHVSEKPRRRPLAAVQEPEYQIGIRPIIDGRREGIRESLEGQTVALAKAVAHLLTENLRHSNGLTVD